ncbi:unnamed protein product [Ostreobium quekettii]|uniref:Uncharacterized protein n=1 Tax=Ostreobium quekettii TaxID=121088 RepID=A0A8S1IP16_9CHLO|nr:unnamed protein product [Ostreobium quekettii]
MAGSPLAHTRENGALAGGILADAQTSVSASPPQALGFFTACLRQACVGSAAKGENLAALVRNWQDQRLPGSGQWVRRLLCQQWRSATTGVAAESSRGLPVGGPELLTAGLSDPSRRQLVWWLGICSAWVASLVVIGGVTRLTRSGLSMTEWKFSGERPPMSARDWGLAFDLYRMSPEWERVNRSISLEEFKFIYWVEYMHRMWGRMLGLVFAGPAVYFLSRGMITPLMGRRLGLLFLMGGTQGLVGWWMVRSGLQEPEDPHAVPRVSPYRLAAHLVSAFGIYALLAWTTMTTAAPTPALSSASLALRQGGARLRGWLIPLSCLVGVTATSGAFVAGMDAGHAFNTWPTMNGQWVPDDYFAIDGPRNFFENTAAVQFNHRLLAYTTVVATLLMVVASRRLALTPTARRLATAAAVVAVGQASLGVVTLLTHVPVALGSAHQVGALSLFTVLLGLLHHVRSPELSAAGAMAARYGSPAAAGCVLLGAALVTQMK